jgi:cytochrome c oxidase subunit 2
MLLTVASYQAALQFGGPQIAVLVLFAFIAAALVAVFVVVARMSRADVPLERVQQVGYRLRRGWLVFLAALGVGTIGVSLFFLPYSGGSATSREVVRVTGGQFYWSVSPNRVPARSEVRFEVGSLDVNHGFGLYSPDDKLLGNVQAMPGYTNKLDIRLSEPGTYRIACLEFCGARHHLMFAEFTVSPSSGRSPDSNRGAE